MNRRQPLDAVPAELLHYVCEYLTFADVLALEDALEGWPHDVVHNYLMNCALKSTKYPLHKFVKANRFDCIKQLAIQSRVDVNARDQLGRTALHAAAERGFVATVQALLQFPSINLDVEDGYGNTPLAVAIWKCRLDVIKLLLRKGAAHKKALYLAVKTGYLDLVNVLVCMDQTDVNETDETNCSPLFAAVKYRRTAIFGRLLSCKGIETEFRERRNLWTPFLLAAARGQTSFLLHLLAHEGVNIHASDRDGRTAISLAAEAGNLTMVALLTTQGIDPHRVDRYGRTCLHYAVQSGYDQVVRFLLQRGCNCQLPDKALLTPICLAVKAKNNLVVEMMLQDALDIDYRALLIAASEHNNAWAARRALQHVSPNIRHKGTVPLLLSTKPAFVRLLLADPRIDPNQSDQHGRTVLINASRHGWKTVVQLLVKKNGLDIAKTDDNQQNATDYADVMNFHDIGKLLRDYARTKAELLGSWTQETDQEGVLETEGV